MKHPLLPKHLRATAVLLGATLGIASSALANPCSRFVNDPCEGVHGIKSSYVGCCQSTSFVCDEVYKSSRTCSAGVDQPDYTVVDYTFVSAGNPSTCTPSGCV